MSPARPDLVECWVFRVPREAIGSSSVAQGSPAEAEPEFLLIRRAAGRIFPGLWQCVTGGPEPDERIPQTALREVAEETGLGPEDVEGFYDLDMVTSFYDEGPDAIVAGAIFALRVRADVEVRLSHEHDDYRWVGEEEAGSLVVWPSYAECLARVRRCLMGLDASWFELDLEGRRLRR